MAASMYLFMTACGNGTSKQDSEEATAASDSIAQLGEVEEPEPTNYEPPFTIIAVREDISKLSNGEPQMGSSRVWYKIQVNKNGTYESEMVGERWLEDAKTWELAGNVEMNKTRHSGRWTLEHRQMGAEFQNVYDLHYPSGRSLFYIPDDLEYFWCEAGGDHSADWSDCANLNLSNAIKVAEIITPKGTKVIIPENERVEPEPEVAPGPTLAGKTFGRTSTQATMDGGEIALIRRIAFTDTEFTYENVEMTNDKETSHETMKGTYKQKGTYIRLGRGIRIGADTDSTYQFGVSTDGTRLTHGLNLIK